MFMNSNSLPIALMQSLVVTVPNLKWGDDDNVDAMVGRALTYLVLYSTLGMVVRTILLRIAIIAHNYSSFAGVTAYASCRTQILRVWTNFLQAPLTKKGLHFPARQSKTMFCDMSHPYCLM